MTAECSVPWVDHPVSHLAEHEAACCTVAKAWFRALDVAFRPNAEAPPAWLAEKFRWGPTAWPAAWCEAAEMMHFDCGVFSAVARDLFHVRGVAAIPVQLVLRCTDDDLRQWSMRWADARAATTWLSKGVAYHEAVGIVGPDCGLRVWDATTSSWTECTGIGYGGVTAVRVIDPPEPEIEWHGAVLPANTWVGVERS